MHPVTLWDLLPARALARVESALGLGRSRSRKRAPAKTVRPATARRPSPMQVRYETMTRELLEAHGIRVRKWRTSMSGVAWEVRYRDGKTARLIEAPRPKGPMSAAVFLHEIGHHVIGLGAYRPRCREEYHAWAWAIAEMERRGISVTESVRRRMTRSLEYAVAKAKRRGIKSIPQELRAFDRIDTPK